MIKTKESGWKVVWRMLSPLLMYEAICLLIQILFAVGVSVQSVLGVDLVEIMNNEASYYQFMNMILEAFYSKMYYSLIIGAVVSIPLLWILMRKDQKKRLAAGMEPVKIHVPVAVYPLVAVVAFACCIGGNNLILSSGLMEMDDTYQQLTELLYSAPLWFQIIGTGMIVPLCEELIFRGLIYNRVKEYVPVKWALLMSALAFGIGHGNMVQGVYGFALGYLMAHLYENTGKLLVPVLFHMVANTISVLITETMLFRLLYVNEITVLMSGAIGVLLAIVAMQAISRIMTPAAAEETYHDYNNYNDQW